jgi:uncharacterized membrane protein YphA (DoxX/SURF4 family)
MIPQLQKQTTVSAVETNSQWSLATKIGFRFTFAYLLLYVGPGAVGSLASYRTPQELENSIWGKIWHPIVPWAGTHILHLTGDFREVPTGSGDELYQYVLIFCMVLAAIGIAAIWSWVDRKRPNYEELYRWLRLFMRLVVAWALLGYGIKKLVGAQFPAPDLDRLMEPFGEASPMSMLWTFMGASQLYSFFGGLGETVGGVLLLFPRLTTLGALVSGAMMTNVLMLNLCYDVPRKIFSIHLVLMCLFLLIPDFHRLSNVLIFNRPTEPVRQPPLLDDKVLNRIGLIAQVAFGAYVLWVAGAQSLRDRAQLYATVPTEVRGVWTVNEFTKDGMVRPPLFSDGDYPRILIFDHPDVLTVISAKGDRVHYYMKADGDRKYKLWNMAEPTRTGSVAVDPQSDRMSIEGQLEGHFITAKMNRLDLSSPAKYPLANKGLHWINPIIDNR